MGIEKVKTNQRVITNINQINVLSLLLLQLRPKQWTKNILIFAALIFSYKIISFQTVSISILSFFIFSFISGCVYILNDFVDIEKDRLHPTKKYRPMASGSLNPYIALSFGSMLLVISLIASYEIHPLFTLILLIYFLLNVAYSFKLKHIVIIDVMIIAAGFVLRAIAGGIVINVSFTPWFLLCTMLLSLFLAISKRRHELILLDTGRGAHRKVLENYSLSLLDQLNCIVTTATLISYSLFTFSSEHTIHLMWTIPIVLYGIFRYLYLIHMEDKGGSPEKVLFEDKHILFTVTLYVVCIITILAIFD